MFSEEPLKLEYTDAVKMLREDGQEMGDFDDLTYVSLP